MSVIQNVVRHPEPIHPGRAALLVGLALYAICVAAEFTGFGPLALGDLRVPVCLGLAFGPFALYLLIKHPMIFPFGAYLFTIPIDVILQQTSGATIARIVAIGAAGVLALHILARREVRGAGKAWYAWLAVVAWMGFSLIWSINVGGSAPIFGTMLSLFLIFTVLTLYPIGRGDLKAVMVLIVTSGVFAAIYGVVAFYSGRVSDSGRLTLRTDSGLNIDPNAFATSFALPIALALVALSTSRNIVVKALAGSSIVLMMISILLTGSRGGLTATLLILVYFVVRSGQRILSLGLAGVALGLSALFPAVWVRFATDDGGQGSGTGRTFIWATGLRGFRDHFLTGSGIGTYSDVYDRNFFNVYQAVFQGWSRPGHSIIVGSLVELGIIGLALILFAWFATFRELRSIPAQSTLYPIRIALEATLLALFYESLTIDSLHLKFYWLAFSMVMLVAGTARNEQAMADAESPQLASAVRSA